MACFVTLWVRLFGVEFQDDSWVMNWERTLKDRVYSVGIYQEVTEEDRELSRLADEHQGFQPGTCWMHVRSHKAHYFRLNINPLKTKRICFI
jgi:hypothetical protein